MVTLVTSEEAPEVTDFLERLGATVRHGSVSQPLMDLAAESAPTEDAASATSSDAPQSAQGGSLAR